MQICLFGEGGIGELRKGKDVAVKQIQHFCANCNTKRLFAKPGVNHLLHGIASLVLINFWIPWFLVWIAATILNGAGHTAALLVGR